MLKLVLKTPKLLSPEFVCKDLDGFRTKKPDLSLREPQSYMAIFPLLLQL